tara:strand:+ start:5300 stop:6337 length:1038 start_codon:yes stop_codon:yes gene_type:complete
MAFRKIKGSFKNKDISTHVIEDTYLAHDTVTGQLRIGDGVTPGGTLVTTSGGGGGGGTTLFVADDSATVEIASGGSLYIQGGDGIQTSANSDGSITVSSTGTSAQGITFVGDDSAGLAIQDGGSLYIRGGSGIETTTNSDGTITVSSTASAGADLGDLQIVGSKLSVQDSSSIGIGIENVRIVGSSFSIDDSTDTGFEFDGHLVPAQDGVYDLGKEGRRWKTAYLSAETIDLGGATISSDGSGSISIASTGVILPAKSKVGTNSIALNGSTDKTSARPVQLVKLFTSDGSTSLTDTQLLLTTPAVTLEFNATIETAAVYTEAGQTFQLANGATLTTQDAVTLFQF